MQENVFLVYLSRTNAEPLKHGAILTSKVQKKTQLTHKIELFPPNETQSIPLDSFNRVKVNSMTCGGTSAGKLAMHLISK